ncbi:uncharacterized protein LOC126834814 [Adelges cooleyi]|uniref:uncharacterized protein LOC126834814 n=1 Tax=Adelges cooleyi TaxID=133065 RepID=UPI0021807ED6|nr:uncharacterized protein LOC126834814 [Adelges cooleyi]
MITSKRHIRLLIFFVSVCIIAVLGVPGIHNSDDSLLSALKVISDKIEDTPSRVVYLNSDDGQPEDIGYGYQKNLRNLENIFEQEAPASQISKDEMVEKLLGYLARDNPHKQFTKKSIFREREDSAEMPENLQQLKYDRFAMPSAFRERYKATPNIVQDYNNNNNMDDQDNYLYTLNSLLDKYIEENIQGMSDEDLESFMGIPDEKRNIPVEYRNLYESNYQRRLPAKRQFFFMPRYPNRKNHKYRNNHWVKPRIMKRSKKNISMNETHTDPKVAAELNNIFLASEKPNSTDIQNKSNDKVLNATLKLEEHQSADDTKIEVKKKSIDWSNYFGFDRKKKSIESIPSDDTILNQYMRAYGKEDDVNQENSIENHLKDEKLMWLEDALIDDALKYTGAKQGTNDPEEINSVKNQVLDTLSKAYSIEKLRHENNGIQGKQYDNKGIVWSTENNSQPIESLDTSGQRVEGEHKECTQLLQITQDCLEIGGSAGDLMLPLCTLYRVCRTCESERSDCEERFIQGSHELCSKAPLCRYFSRRILQLMQDNPLQMDCHKCMINFFQNEN